MRKIQEGRYVTIPVKQEMLPLLHRTLLLSICLLLLLAGRSQTYSTIPVTGFNEDVIANGSTLLTSVTADADGANYYFLNQTFTAFGTPTYSLPTSGTINSASTSGLTFQMADATGPNTLRLSTAVTSGTLNFVTPQQAGTLYLLVTSGSGASTINVTVTFSDATTQVFTGFSIPDWYGTGTTAMQGIGRTSTTALEGTSTNPKLFQIALTLSGANFFKNITGISVTRVSGGVPHVMAVSKAAACAIPPASPTLLNLSAVSTSSISGSFTAAVPAADQYLVVQYLSGATPVDPSHGTTYSAGQSLGSGTVIQSSATTTFTASGLSASTGYTYYIYPLNNTG
ncbi:MAG TPA: hypothetical protein VFZ78_07490, partial [Flavisolibacter sp.]